MGQSKLKYNNLEECRLGIEKVATNIKEIGNDYLDEIEKIEKNDYWTGNASIKFQKEANKTKQLFEKIYANLQLYANNLSDMIENYRMVDNIVMRDKDKRMARNVETYNTITTSNDINTYKDLQDNKTQNITVGNYLEKATNIINVNDVVDNATLAVNSIKNINTYKAINGAVNFVKDINAPAGTIDVDKK